eukprot:IDg15861t1
MRLLTLIGSAIAKHLRRKQNGVLCHLQVLIESSSSDAIRQHAQCRCDALQRMHAFTTVLAVPVNKYIVPGNVIFHSVEFCTRKTEAPLKILLIVARLLARVIKLEGTHCRVEVPRRIRISSNCQSPISASGNDEIRKFLIDRRILV